jgi:hypothetical protein
MAVKTRVSKLGRIAMGGESVAIARTAHDCADAGDEVDDLGLDAGVGADTKGRVIGTRGEVDYARRFWSARRRPLWFRAPPSLMRSVAKIMSTAGQPGGRREGKEECCCPGGMQGLRTACEETVLIEDGHGVDEE